MKSRAFIIAGAAAFIGPFACTRYADIRDEPDASLFEGHTPTIEAGVLPELDAGLNSDAYPACLDRPMGNCYGTLDFPCGFVYWANTVADKCQKETGCKTNGWLQVTMNHDGCVSSIAMDEPNPEIVACLMAEFAPVNCPCNETETTHFFGLGNTGVCPK